MTDLRAVMAAARRGDADTVVRAMGPTSVVRDQRLGVLDGAQGVRRWATDSAVWLEGLAAEATELSHTASDDRLVLELSLDLTVDGEVVDLPYVIVADRGPSGFTELRTYHSTWPYTGQHVFRPPPLAGRPTESVPDIFSEYIARISVADIDWVLQNFTEDGYVREPSGNRWRHAGPDGRAAFYGHLIDAPRARFDLSTSTVEGGRIAVEYAFAYGDAEMVGGVCIMEVRGDRIAAVRITDDVAA
ncbi:MAG: nuclear transport factor 2 family protein [Myxococcales bacterium]|nr:nuclear transport factor 2 family protein [Myxococcales bacterium]